MNKKLTVVPALYVDPLLTEEVVFLAERGQVLTPSPFHQEREMIYQNFPSREREGVFQEFYERWFETLGFRGFIEQILTEFPHLADPSVTVLLRRASSRQEERGQLYKEGNDKRIVIGLQPAHVLDHQWLEHFLHTELMLLSDILDPAFQYSPDPDFGGASEVENSLIRERFCLLWEAYVRARLQQKEIKQNYTQQDLIGFARNGKNVL
ncbi:MAG: hypothetical protein HYS56_03460 [Candidatus Omnitrophica bacterium]|nr:hypothetical protein [Candidatus Omnitrophota bacterium]